MMRATAEKTIRLLHRASSHSTEETGPPRSDIDEARVISSKCGLKHSL